MVRYFDGTAFEFSYENISADWERNPEDSEFGRVKEALIDHFGDSEYAQDLIQNEMSAELRSKDLVVSLREMDRALEKPKLNEKENFGFIRTSIMKIPSLAIFCLRSCSDNLTTNQAVMDYQKGEKAFQASPRDVVPNKLPVRPEVRV